MADLKIPYVPTFGHVGETLKQLAPQIAAQYLHVAWEAINNAASRVKTQAILAGPSLWLMEALASQEALRVQSRPVVADRGGEEPQTWGSLGDIEFDLMGGPTRLDCQEGMTYVRHGVIGAKPRVQFTAPELQEIRLELSWHRLATPDLEDRLRALLEAMRERRILDLIIGDDTAGAIYGGRYVIQRIPHTVERHNPDGSMLTVQLTVELLEWVEAPTLKATAGPAVKVKKTPPATAAQAKRG